MGRSKASLVAWRIALLTVVTNVWGGHSYSQRDRMALKRCADAVAEALELAESLGHSLEPKWR